MSRFDWLKLCFYNCMENMERFTPLYTIAYKIMNSMENLRFGKEDYFHVLVFYTGYFIKEIEKLLLPVFPFGRTQISISRSPKRPLVFL